MKIIEGYIITAMHDANGAHGQIGVIVTSAAPFSQSESLVSRPVHLIIDPEPEQVLLDIESATGTLSTQEDRRRWATELAVSVDRGTGAITSEHFLLQRVENILAALDGPESS